MHGQVVGALSLYHQDAAAPPAAAADAAAMLAEAAVACARHLREHAELGRLADQLQGALDSRIPIEQAKGYVAARLDLTTADAFELLRDHARSNGHTLDETCRDVVTGELSLTSLHRP